MRQDPQTGKGGLQLLLLMLDAPGQPSTWEDPLETHLMGLGQVQLGVECPQAPKSRKEELFMPAYPGCVPGAVLSQSHVPIYLITVRTLRGRFF